MTSALYCEVALPLPLRTTYTYVVPAALADAVHTIGVHYSSSTGWKHALKEAFASTREARQTGKPIWASEDGPWGGDWEGARSIARIFNRSYIVGKTTKTITWSLITSYYDNLPIPGSGPMKANTPSVLIVSGPKEEIVQSELRALSDYLDRGGRILFMLDPYSAPGLVRFLKSYNIMVGDNMVVDKESKLLAGDVFSPVVPLYGRHPITLDFDAATVFPLVTSVEPIDPPVNDRADVKPLALTTPESWAETNRESIKQGAVYFQEWEDKKGPVSIAMVGELSTAKQATDMTGAGEGPVKTAPPGRMVVCGDSDFASNLYLPFWGIKTFSSI